MKINHKKLQFTLQRFLFLFSLFLIFSGKLIAQESFRLITDGTDFEDIDAPDVNFWSDLPNDELARKIVDQMTDSELYSQILMFGWAGKEPPELIYQWISRGLGSVKVFGWNTDDLHLLASAITSLQRSANQTNRFKIPLFVATDQEGGWIRHVKGATSVTPGNMAIGAAGYPADAWYSAYYICNEIKALGINMNFAPTVDLFTNHNSSIIGTRSFGEDPVKSGILGAAFAAGSTAAGIIPTVKHFPGHGDTSIDSHGRLPIIDVDINTFKNRELVPFIYLINENVPAVMSGHLSFPQIDPSGAPASLSKLLLSELLRKQLGYKGLIITDDMTMVGATSYAGSLSVAFQMAVEAGNDIILSSKTARLNEALWVNNLDLISSDKNFKQRVKDAAYNVIKAKLDYFKNSSNSAPLYPDESAIDQNIPSPQGEKFFLEQACRSITVFKQDLKQTEGRVLLAGSLNSFFKEGKKRFPESGEFHFTYDIGPNETQWVIDNMPAVARNFDTIILCVSSENHVKIAQNLKNMGKKVIILCTMSPEFANSLTWADTVLLGYSWRCDYSLQAMLGVVNGEFEAEGVRPY